MPIEPGADYASASTSDVVLTDTHGSRWRLALDSSTTPPTLVLSAVNTWAHMKSLFASWAAAKATGATWGIAKGF